MTDRLFAGVDIGGTKIAVLVADESGRLLARHRVDSGSVEAERAATAIATAVGDALASADRDARDLAAVGIGVPGRVDPLAGTVSLAVNLGWGHVPLGPAIAAMLGVPVAVENDVRAAASGLHARRVAADVDDLAYIGIGTGVAAGIVLGGRLHRGRHGLAGEIGHVVRDPEGPRCACGLRGCLEALVSGRGIASLASAAVGRATTAVEVYRAAAAGDPTARQLTAQAGRHLARAIHELVMTYDLERVFLGGGVTHAGAAFIEPVLAGLDELRSASELAHEVLRPDIVTLLPPDADAAGWGAVVLAQRAAASTVDAAPSAPGADGRR